MLANLKAEMARNDVTSKDIASLLNVNERTVRNWLNGRTDIGIKQARELKEWLFPDCTMDYLFEEKTAS